MTLPKATGLFLGFAVWRYLSCFIRDKSQFNLALIIFALIGLGFTVVAALSVNWVDKVPIIADALHLLPNQVITLPESHALGTHANELAGTLLIFMFLPLSFLIALWRNSRFRRLTWAVALFALLLTFLLVLTQSRSGWIGAIAGFMTLFAVWSLALPVGKKRLYLRLILVGSVLVVLVGLLLIGPERLRQLTEDPAQQTLIGSLGTVSFRFEVWRWAVMAVGDFPFTGTGLGTFRRVIMRLYPARITPGVDIAHAHNIFLQVALDVGLPGLIVYMALLFMAAAITWQIVRRDSVKLPVTAVPTTIALFSGIVALHVYGLSDAIALGAKPGLLFWFALGLLTAVNQLRLALYD
ncbi:MAG: O-antigen ligase family protein [Ardenticatenaceae bacterium]|nr:O-antigen ligase family protein [Anaerolineales bacterium]MCB8920933.1 O-antigen ligase family protein [Ardenticatenaceae bacterium]MCB9005510.1 O-antigen ligase family protein [Ardenticatenaceae bacterium]